MSGHKHDFRGDPLSCTFPGCDASPYATITMTPGRRLYELWLQFRDVSPDDLWDLMLEQEPDKAQAWERLANPVAYGGGKLAWKPRHDGFSGSWLAAAGSLLDRNEFGSRKECQAYIQGLLVGALDESRRWFAKSGELLHPDDQDALLRPEVDAVERERVVKITESVAEPDHSAGTPPSPVHHQVWVGNDEEGWVQVPRVTNVDIDLRQGELRKAVITALLPRVDFEGGRIS